MRKIDYLTLALVLVMILSAAGLSETVSASFFAPSSARAPRAALATAPPLGTADFYAVLGGSTVTNTGDTTVSGNLGVSPGTAVVGFPPGLVTGGTIHAGDAEAAQAQTDLTTAYNNLAGQACDFNLTGQDLGGLTLVPGVYCFDVEAQLTGVLTLDAEGNPDAVWVFQIGSTLTTASNASVVMINSGNPCSVYWQVGSSATLGTDTAFTGSILALTSITLNTGADVVGRVLARNGAVTMDTNDISVAPCASPELPTATATSAVTATSVVTVTATTAVTATATSAVTTTATSAVTTTATSAVTAAATSAPTSAPTSVPTAVQTAVPSAAAGTAPTTTTAVPAQTSEGTQGILPAAGVAGAVGGNTGGLIAGATVGLSAMVIWLRSRRRA